MSLRRLLEYLAPMADAVPGRGASFSPMNYQAVLQVEQGSKWLGLRNPIQVIAASAVEEILPALHQIEAMVEERGLWAVGYISYEAAPAFDSALKVRPGSSMPLLWFGLYSKVEELTLPEQGAGYTIGDWTPSVPEDEYAEAIARIKELIALGRTYQVNFTMRLKSQFEGDAWGLFVDLNRAQMAHYGAYIDTGEAVICSASPELFFELQGYELTSRPMKGTIQRGRTTEEDRHQAAWLRDSAKDQAENVMIVDMIRNDMGRISHTGSVEVPQLFLVERYPTVWQMTSTVRSRTSESITDILTALFPCASITGAPKVSTMEIIAGLESSPRGVYTGCIGYMAPNRQAQFNVAIRSVVVNQTNGVAEYGVGGGIVWDSETELEYQECQTKALVLTERRPVFELLESILWTPKEGYFLLEEHLQRLLDSAEYFDFFLDAETVEMALLMYAADFAEEPAKVRLLVSQDGDFEVQHVPVGSDQPVNLAMAHQPVYSTSVYLYHKTTHRKIYEEALSIQELCDDVLLWNEKGEITETTTANIVIELDGSLYTPPVDSGLLPGTFRSWLLERGEIQERVIRIEDLEDASRLFVVNSVRKWRPAALISERSSLRLSLP